jgi:hypothetical protein
MTVAEGVIRSDALTRSGDDVTLAVHLPWHSSLPLACLEAVTVRVDGSEAAAADPVISTVGPEGFRGRLSEAATSEATWDLRDPVLVSLTIPPPPAGTPHEVVAEIACRIPYIVVGPGTPLVMRTQARATVVAR